MKSMLSCQIQATATAANCFHPQHRKDPRGLSARLESGVSPIVRPLEQASRVVVRFLQPSTARANSTSDPDRARGRSETRSRSRRRDGGSRQPDLSGGGGGGGRGRGKRPFGWGGGGAGNDTRMYVDLVAPPSAYGYAAYRPETAASTQRKGSRAPSAMGELDVVEEKTLGKLEGLRKRSSTRRIPRPTRAPSGRCRRGALPTGRASMRCSHVHLSCGWSTQNFLPDPRP